MKMLVIPFVATALLYGCASAPPAIWNKAGGTQEQFSADIRECSYEAKKAAPWRQLGDYTAQVEVFEACLRSRSYVKSGNGNSFVLMDK